jgi:hypothetical protein
VENSKEKYHFDILELQRSEGGEDREFKCYHIEFPVREIALTIGSRESSQSLISLKAEP